MPPRPLHRWKSFWLGVLIIAFLGWAWVASMRHVDVLYWNSAVGSSTPSPASKNFDHFVYRNFGRFVLTAGQTLGWVEVKWDTSRFSPLASHWSHQIITLTPKETWFARAVRVERYPGRLEVFVAHWLLILLFALPWATCLFYRHRRMKRLDTSK
ncbi:hypothetical protein [Luteolibacter soli]|uniref:DUF3592 domain-containing protein n=1 Tax=Luteolibacter soli TaxID=3135280 RepID=A0ABU9B5E3_9BACT